MSVIQSFLLGLVEGVTEFLPISSTGHLILFSEWLGVGTSEFLKSFEIIIQFGAILSVVVLYWKSFFNIEILKRLIVAFIPTALLGLIFYRLVKSNFLENENLVLFALLVGGLVLIIFEFWHKEGETANEDISRISYMQSLWIGFFQSIAIIPGVSRSAATIIGGLMVGLRRTAIVEFSFMLAVPTMLAASGLDFINNRTHLSGDQLLVLLIGFGTSFLVALLSIKFLLNYVRRHSFILFGVYRIVLAVIFWQFILR